MNDVDMATLVATQVDEKPNRFVFPWRGRDARYAA